MVVYPRWRGELFCALAFCWLSRGLSPLARGTLCRCQHCWRVIRFIPAGAGNTKFILINTAFVSVYPRWRGEHFTTIGGHATAHGLSPLARGTQIWGAPLMKSKRFIPAGPRTHEQAITDRFIPAGAGNTSCLMCRWPGGTVYPRWRGEHPFIFVSSWRDLGLSPLARGTRTKYPSLNPRRRFIPAGAGNTIETFHAIKQAAVYPRWRGEHLLIKWRARCVYGLSPLARGTPVVRY